MILLEKLDSQFLKRLNIVYMSHVDIYLELGCHGNFGTIEFSVASTHIHRKHKKKTLLMQKNKPEKDLSHCALIF